EKPPADESSNAMFSFAFKVEATDDAVRAQREALSLVVSERNALIHEMLATFDPGSDESCQRLITVLEEQHDRLRPHYQSVMVMLGTLHSMQKQVLEELEAQVLRADAGGGDAV